MAYTAELQATPLQRSDGKWDRNRIKRYGNANKGLARKRIGSNRGLC